MKRLLSVLLAILLTAGTFTACEKKEGNESTANNSITANIDFETFTNDLFLEEISSNTINLHYTVENPAALGIDGYEISLGDFSKMAFESASEHLIETKNELQSFSYKDLSLENQLTYDILQDYLNTQITLGSYSLYQEPLAFSGGLQMELPILYAEYEFKSEQDVKDYLKLIALTDEFFNQIMSFEAEKSYNRLFMSPDLCTLVIESCKSFLLDKENHYLITTFKSRLENLNLSEQKKASYSRQNETILEKQLFPAYENMIEKLTELQNTGINSLGICYLEGGKEYYETLVYAQTGCEDSIDTIFRRIENQRMADLLVCAQLQKENENLIQECDSLKWEMSDPNTMLTHLKTAIVEDFPAPPDCTYEINYVEPALEEYLAPAFYIIAPIDNYQENVIYINDNYISSDIYGFTTLAHEGYPGHLYQTVMTYTYDFPNIRSVLDYAGFAEGWATYIEMIAYDYAGLDENIASFLSHNQASILSLYATSDIGLHYYGWTIEEMKAFWSGYGITSEAAINEITQLILSEPGNYLKYYIGYLEFLELKDYAKELYGKEYSDKQFHQAVLDIGPAPFHLLEKYLPKYYSPQT